jgi:hypothetical protein
VVIKLRPGLALPALRAAIVNLGYGGLSVFSFLLIRVLCSCARLLLKVEFFLFLLSSSSSIFSSTQACDNKTADLDAFA